MLVNYHQDFKPSMCSDFFQGQLDRGPFYQPNLSGKLSCPIKKKILSDNLACFWSGWGLSKVFGPYPWVPSLKTSPNISITVTNAIAFKETAWNFRIYALKLYQSLILSGKAKSLPLHCSLVRDCAWIGSSLTCKY